MVENPHATSMWNRTTETGQAAYFGVCDKTIRTWVASGKLSTTVTIGGHRRIDISKPTDVRLPIQTERIVATYARVSSKKQVGNHVNQQTEITDAASAKFPTKTIRGFVDVGSGLNFKRPNGARNVLLRNTCIDM